MTVGQLFGIGNNHSFFMFDCTSIRVSFRVGDLGAKVPSIIVHDSDDIMYADNYMAELSDHEVDNVMIEGEDDDIEMIVTIDEIK